MTDTISLWDKISQAAKSLDIPDMTIAQWKSRGYVPPSRHYEIIKQSTELGLGLKQEQLHSMWKDKRKLPPGRE